ncbi:hypothetical protein S245_056547, partial [Arachis hypogaea]
SIICVKNHAKLVNKQVIYGCKKFYVAMAFVVMKCLGWKNMFFFQFCDELVEQGLKCTRQMRVQKIVAMFLNTDPKFQNVHSKMKNDQRYWSFFKNAIGAIDGTHIPCVVSPSDQPKFIRRKGYPTQNIMAVCDWDMCFIFALPGWEGTAHDARIFDNAITTPTMNFLHPPPDFRRSSGFTNHNEVFNYYHSSLRCTIERTFGVWKNRFAILRHMPKFKIETQVQIVYATMAIHNFIRRHSETDT